MQALASGKAETQREAAKMVGLSEEHVSVTLKKPQVAAELERLRMRRFDRGVDKARRIAEKALDRVEFSLEQVGDDSDPRESVQVAALAISAAAKHTEAYGQAEHVEDESGVKARLRRQKLRWMLRGIEIALRRNTIELQSLAKRVLQSKPQ